MRLSLRFSKLHFLWITFNRLVLFVFLHLHNFSSVFVPNFCVLIHHHDTNRCFPFIWTEKNHVVISLRLAWSGFFSTFSFAGLFCKWKIPFLVCSFLMLIVLQAPNVHSRENNTSKAHSIKRSANEKYRMNKQQQHQQWHQLRIKWFPKKSAQK